MEGQELLLLIDSLKDEEQELLLLKYYYQLSYAEIALILELSVENVRKKLYRTRQKLKKNWRNRSGFKKSIRKAKRKQFIMIGAITVVSFAVLFVGFFVGMDKLSTKNYHTLLEVINDQEMIASPNTQLDSQVIVNSSPFGGEVVTNRSKILMVTRWSGVIYVADIAFSEIRLTGMKSILVAIILLRIFMNTTDKPSRK